MLKLAEMQVYRQLLSRHPGEGRDPGLQGRPLHLALSGAKPYRIALGPWVPACAGMTEKRGGYRGGDHPNIPGKSNPFSRAQVCAMS